VANTQLSFLLMVATGLVLLAVLALAADRLFARRRSATVQEQLDAVLNAGGPRTEAAASRSHADRVRQLVDTVANLGERVSASRFGQMSLEDEDVRLLALCNLRDLRSRYVFLASRVVLPIVLMLAVLIFYSGAGAKLWIGLFAALSVGFLSPKWVLQSVARRRKARIDVELPWLLELLQLMMGVGMSVDQSLQMVINDFRSTAPVLASELEIANQQFAVGRSREQSLQRLVKLFDNEDLKTFVDLLLQVDRFGGAVQEPLKRFGDRLLEQRRNRVREKIGKLTVKMSAVMILFLMPALMIVAGGPGFLGVIRAFSNH
jgi:tight adherence protein C